MATYGREIHAISKAVGTIRTSAANHPSPNNKGELSCMQVQTLLAIALQPGIDTETLRKAVGMSQSSASRNTMALSKWTRLNEPGADYVEVIEDPRERRKKIYFLTHRGKVAVQQALEALSGKPVTDFESPTAQQWERGIRR